MKHVLLAATALFVTTTTATARDGVGDFARGSHGWFLEESAEHALRTAGAMGSIDSVTALSVAVVSATETSVRVETSDGELNFSCYLVDEWSRSGTVLKKEVLCR
jgi:hypothetical protein